MAVNDQVTVGFTEAIDPNAPPGDSCACGSAASIGVWSGQEVMEQVREEETVGSVAGDSAIIPEEAAPKLFLHCRIRPERNLAKYRFRLPLQS